jgi:hypothetical protein
VRGRRSSACRFACNRTRLDRAPAHELAALYHQRWEIETALDVLEMFRGIGPHSGRFSRRACAPDGMEESFAGYHRTTQTVIGERFLQPREDLCLAIGHKIFRTNYVGIVGCPIPDADPGKVAHHLGRRCWLSCWSMEECLSLVRCCPLWSADIVLAPRLGWITPPGKHPTIAQPTTDEHSRLQMPSLS